MEIHGGERRGDDTNGRKPAMVNKSFAIEMLALQMGGAEKDDEELRCFDLRLLRLLCSWFKRDFFKWVDKPPRGLALSRKMFGSPSLSLSAIHGVTVAAIPGHAACNQ